jgi:uncharacterized protein (DUF2236 family)
MSARYPHVDPNTLPFARAVKRRIAAEVVSIFNDRAKGQTPVVRRPDGLFGPESVVWRVHGDVTAMMVGGVSGLLLQMLHPAVLAGVWDHSNFRDDLLGRLRRTARFIALTSYGAREEAEAAIARVRAIHAQVTGVLPDGSTYRGDDPRLLAWVHVTEATSFLGGWIRYAEPRMPAADRDRYFAEMARLGEALGADPVPRSQIEAQRLIEAMRPELNVDDRTREVAALVLGAPAHRLGAEPLQRLTMQAAVDLLPGWARQMHGLAGPGPFAPLVRAGTSGIARTLRWAFG